MGIEPLFTIILINSLLNLQTGEFRNYFVERKCVFNDYTNLTRHTHVLVTCISNVKIYNLYMISMHNLCYIMLVIMFFLYFCTSYANSLKFSIHILSLIFSK